MLRLPLIALLSALFIVFAPQAASLSSPAEVQQYPVLEAATSSDASFNWAGYVAGAGAEDTARYTAVAGSWIVPEVAASSGRVAADATWVGIGGVQSADLLQAGTQAVVEPDGQVYYEAWLERLPGASQMLPLDIAPGDEVSVSLAEQAAGQWSVRVQNITTGKSVALSVPYRSSESSAEWIEEMPSTARGSFIPLADFGTTRFLAGSATVDGTPRDIAGAGGSPLVMINRRGQALATPSVLDERGGFVIARTPAEPERRGRSGYAR